MSCSSRLQVSNQLGIVNFASSLGKDE